jgi:hypothetical protein
MTIFEENKKLLKIIGWIILGLLVLFFVERIYKGIQTKKKEDNYLNGTLYLNFPPDPYPNFPDSSL